MRNLISLLLSSAVLLVACSTTAPPEGLPVAQASSAKCISSLDWGLSARRGASLYNGSCIYCHGRGGMGKAGQVPALAGNSGLIADPDRGIRMLLVTQSQAGRSHGMEYDDMIAILGELNENDLADSLTYILSSWGNCAGPIGPNQVSAVKSSM